MKCPGNDKHITITYLQVHSHSYSTSYSCGVMLTLLLPAICWSGVSEVSKDTVNLVACSAENTDSQKNAGRVTRTIFWRGYYSSFSPVTLLMKTFDCSSHNKHCIDTHVYPSSITQFDFRSFCLICEMGTKSPFTKLESFVASTLPQQLDNDKLRWILHWDRSEFLQEAEEILTDFPNVLMWLGRGPSVTRRHMGMLRKRLITFLIRKSTLAYGFWWINRAIPEGFIILKCLIWQKKTTKIKSKVSKTLTKFALYCDSLLFVYIFFICCSYLISMFKGLLHGGGKAASHDSALSI